MQGLPPSSSDSRPPSATRGGSSLPPPPPAWRTNLFLFLATVVSVFANGSGIFGGAGETWREMAINGGQFAGALMAILLAHEFGHYIAARIHKVDASLPYFIPLPFFSPFGTMGAVIRMQGLIPTRRALLDIGAAGPLAGLCVAVPLYVWGIARSHVIALDDYDSAVLGDSILVRVLNRIAGPEIPAGSDVLLSPVAFAAWAGFFVTMINLLPIGQLDGGHVAYSLFGTRQDKLAKWVHRSMLAFFFVSLASYVSRDLQLGVGLIRIGKHVSNSIFWFVWFEVVVILGALSGRDKRAEEGSLALQTRVIAVLGLAVIASVGRDSRSPLLWGAWFVGLAALLVMERKWGVLKPTTLLDHPPTGAEPLGTGRKVIAVVTLLFFILLFMPTPFAL